MSILDPFTGSISIDTAKEIGLSACGVAASQGMSVIDGDINDVQNNWNPGDLYTTDQMEQIVNFAIETLTRASTLVESALRLDQVDMHRELLTDAIEEGTRHSLVNPTPFVNAVRTARQADIKVIESKGFKRWVVNVLKAARKAKFAYAVVDCARPSFLLDLSNQVTSAIAALMNAIKSVVVTTAKALQAAGNAVLKIPDILGSVFTALKFAPWVLLAFGGYYVAVKSGRVPDRYDPLKLRERDTWRPWRRIGQ